MKILNNKNIILLNSIIIIFFFSVISFAQNADNKQTEDQYKLKRYDDIKKNKDKEYKKGAYNDEKKDVVNNWIGEDINYQKRVIKLKSDYRAWAEKKISAKEDVIFKDYEPLKTLSRNEKQVLQEYHNKLFGKEVKKTSGNRKTIEKRVSGKGIIKKPVDETPGLVKYAIAFQPDAFLKAERADNNYLVYLLIATVGLIIIAGAFIFIGKKNYNKTRTKNKKHLPGSQKKKKQGR
jgi:hypothetical protein